MNKFGFVSSLLTLLLVFLEFIPLGLYIGVSGATSSWVFNIFGITTNPWLKAYAHFPLEFFNDGELRIFIWGVIRNGDLNLWSDIHLLSFLVLFLLSLVKGILTLIGSFKETGTGKKLMIFNFIALLIVIFYIIAGIPIFSLEIFGNAFDVLELIDFLEISFLLLLIDGVFSYYAFNHHPIKEEF